MNTLRFITAGNVDDGKSTLIGRLLYDSGSIHTDQLGLLKKQGEISGSNIDLSLITDGLRSEREQGITIDVAYKYFSTTKRKFIIADAPGHEQYTRNMITGASNSDVIIILVDARKGITEQTRRHASIASLIGIRKAIVAINKIDLVNYSAQVFERIKEDFIGISDKLNFDEISYVPVSALEGDNIVTKSLFTAWYPGKPLLQILEEIEISSGKELPARFQVQWVIRPKDDKYHDYRGYAGPVLSGNYSVGDKVRILSSGIETTISSIEQDGKNISEATAGQNIVLHFSDNIDISRGDGIIASDGYIENSTEIRAWISWLDKEPLKLDKTYILQHRFRNLRAKIIGITNKWDVNQWEFTDANEISQNDIAQIVIRTNQPVHFDAFEKNSKTGNGILIDETTFSTVGGLMFLENTV
ncbi:sulfate adenylyltransferase subunit 1 [Flavobacterium suzhouense]|uniref:sulfate adenylyltransferase n=1 Tax=Flavobacterium suzhouense TaxID=1529638 RepID=A0ABW5NWB9_9FLAO